MDLLTRRGAKIGTSGANTGVIGANTLGAGLSYIVSTISPLPSVLITQVMDPIVNDWPGSGKIMELGKLTIWLAMESARTPPTWHATINEIWLAVYREVYPR